MSRAVDRLRDGGRALLWTVVLLALPLAGCTAVPGFGGGADGPDGADGSEGDDLVQPGPVTRDDCDTVYHVRNYKWNAAYMPRSDGNGSGSGTGHTLDRVHCWSNWNQTGEDPATVYFVFARESGFPQGEWEYTVYDADGDVFRHATLAQTQSYECNEVGVRAPMGNWTVVHELRDFAGRLTARLCLDPPGAQDEDGQPLCFNQCPG